MQVIIPSDKIRLQKQIEALKWQIDRDTNEKDKRIHQQVLKDMQAATEP